MRVPSLLIAVTLGVAPGCGSQAEVSPTGAAPSPVPSPVTPDVPSPITSPTSAANSDAMLPTTMDAAATWRGLAGKLQVQAIAAMDRPIRWHIPDCALGYGLRTAMVMRTEGSPGEPTGVYLEGLLTARTREGATDIWELTPALQTGFITDETRSPATELPPGTFARPRITSDGEAWRELDGPTALWSASSGSPGLIMFFPALPRAPEPGALFDWKPMVHLPAAAMAVEAARGSLKLPAGASAEVTEREAAATPLAVRVQSLRWIEVDGEAALELAASWRTQESLADEDRPGAPPSEANSRFEGHYVVLASGRLLHAAIRGVVDVTLQTGAASPMLQHIEHRHELGLVSACGGPVLPSPLDERSPAERSLAAPPALRGALLAGDRTQVAALLSPTLIAAHGEQALVDLLLRHLRRFGPGSLGEFGPMPPETIERAGDRFTFTGHGAQEGRSDLQQRVTVVVDASGGAPRIASLRAMRMHDEALQLEISAERLFSSAANFVAAPTPPRTVLTTSVTRTADDQHFMLARRGDDLCAFKLRESSADRTSYEWYAQKLADRGPLASATHGSDALSEQEPRDDSIDCGPITILWSSGGYLHFEDPALELASTQATTIATLDPRAPELLWFSRRWGHYAYDEAADQAANAGAR